MAPHIAADEWRAEIERVMGRSSDQGMTSREIAKSLRLSIRITLERIRPLAEAGALGIGRRSVKTIDGRDTWVTVYWVKSAKKA